MRERLEEIKEIHAKIVDVYETGDTEMELVDLLGSLFTEKHTDWLIEQAETQVIKQVTEKAPGGGSCPSCNVRLIGKANYCGKCGQKVGWKIYE